MIYDASPTLTHRSTSAAAAAETSTFPTTLPDVVLTRLEKSCAYGLKRHEVSDTLKAELGRYLQYNRNMIQVDRVSGALQSETLEQHSRYQKSFLGYCVRFHHEDLRRVSLTCYRNREYIISFIGVNGYGRGGNYLCNIISIDP